MPKQNRILKILDRAADGLARGLGAVAGVALALWLLGGLDDVAALVHAVTAALTAHASK